jgi:hypothetical protein
MVQAGSNGAFEMTELLADDRSVFGVVRMAFGTGRFRRTKRVFFLWHGDAVGAVSKGRANANRGAMMELVGPTNVDIMLNGADDRSVDAVISKVQSVFVVDNINLPAGEKPKPISAEEYVKALEEEQRATSAFYDEPEDMPAASAVSPRSSYGIQETLDLIHGEDSGLTWAMFQFA